MLRGKSRARISRSVQRYFPQCVACCSKQAGAVKSGATRLVFHYYGMRPWYYAGKALCCSCPAYALQCRAPSPALSDRVATAVCIHSFIHYTLSDL